uniref:DUF4440 domain-containing protein n=1 Tax=Heterorhabditis bacteriophora TaxID=37862 RepID=A0A1I7WJ30_HETBA
MHFDETSSSRLNMSTIEEILKPLYAEIDTLSQSGDVDKLLDIYHPQAVIVEKGKSATFGRAAINDLFKKLWELVGPHKIIKTNEIYQGSADYSIVHYDFEIASEKGSKMGTMVQLWKKENGKWAIYHEEYEAQP